MLEGGDFGNPLVTNVNGEVSWAAQRCISRSPSPLRTKLDAVRRHQKPVLEWLWHLSEREGVGTKADGECPEPEPWMALQGDED